MVEEGKKERGERVTAWCLDVSCNMHVYLVDILCLVLSWKEIEICGHFHLLAAGNRTVIRRRTFAFGVDLPR